MEVRFFYNRSDSRVINKNIIAGETFEGQARNECNVMAPIIMFEKNDVLRYNYAYIPEFQRYYAVVSRNAYREGLWEVQFEVDVLMSFRNDIVNLNVVVDKQSMSVNGDEYIDDGSLVAENVMFQRIYNYPEGFNENPELILITAG